MRCTLHETFELARTIVINMGSNKPRNFNPSLFCFGVNPCIAVEDEDEDDDEEEAFTGEAEPSLINEAALRRSYFFFFTLEPK